MHERPVPSQGAIWFWTVVMTPIAIVVIVGVVASQLRSTAPAVERNDT